MPWLYPESYLGIPKASINKNLSIIEKLRNIQTHPFISQNKLKNK
jgi:hypothetical protein